MKRSLLLLALLSVIPYAQSEAQRSRRNNKDSDSSATALEAVRAGVGYGAGLLSLFAFQDDGYAGSDAWCVGNCVTPRSSRAALLSGGTRGPAVRTGESDEGDAPLAVTSRARVIVETFEEAVRRDGFGTTLSALVREYSSWRHQNELAMIAMANQGPVRTAEPVSRPVEMDSPGNCPEGGCVFVDVTPPNVVGVTEPEPLETNDDSPFVPPTETGGNVLAPGSPVNTVINPEPGTIALMLSGLAGLAFVRRRSRTR